MSDEGKVFLTGSAQGSLVAGAEDRAQIYIPYASEEGSNRGASKFPKILLKRIPGTQSFRRVASSNRFKKSERSHLCTSVSYVHYKLSSEYRVKRRLCVQDRPCRMRTFIYQSIQAAGSTSGLPSKTSFISLGYFPSFRTQPLRFLLAWGTR